MEGQARAIVTLSLQGSPARDIRTQLARPERAVYRVVERIKKWLQHLRAQVAEDS